MKTSTIKRLSLAATTLAAFAAVSVQAEDTVTTASTEAATTTTVVETTTATTESTTAAITESTTAATTVATTEATTTEASSLQYADTLTFRADGVIELVIRDETGKGGITTVLASDVTKNTDGSYSLALGGQVFNVPANKVSVESVAATEAQPETTEVTTEASTTEKVTTAETVTTVAQESDASFAESLPSGLVGTWTSENGDSITINADGTGSRTSYHQYSDATGPSTVSFDLGSLKDLGNGTYVFEKGTNGFSITGKLGGPNRDYLFGFKLIDGILTPIYWETEEGKEFDMSKPLTNANQIFTLAGGSQNSTTASKTKTDDRKLVQNGSSTDRAEDGTPLGKGFGYGFGDYAVHTYSSSKGYEAYIVAPNGDKIAYTTNPDETKDLEAWVRRMVESYEAGELAPVETSGTTAKSTNKAGNQVIKTDNVTKAIQETSKVNNQAKKANDSKGILPNTGESASIGLTVAGILAVVGAYFGFKKKNAK